MDYACALNLIQYFYLNIYFNKVRYCLTDTNNLLHTEGFKFKELGTFKCQKLIFGQVWAKNVF